MGGIDAGGVQADIEAEMQGRLALRKRLGAREDETMGAFTERLATMAGVVPVQDRNELVKERVAHEGTKYMLDCERHEHDLTKAARDRLRNEPHLIEAGQTRYDTEVWRARCQDAEAILSALRAAADYHADRGGTDLGRALAKVGER